uniref:C13 family peptidase n=1 Tax=uncultured Acidovorax sp. TaxID=158751 RepID=UPI0030FA244C
MPVTGGSAPYARHVRYGADSPQGLPPSTIFRQTTTMFSTATASSRRGLLSAGALWAAVLAAGCATAPEPAPAPVAPPPPAPVAEAPAPLPPPRLIFAGFALHSQAKAFRNDVLAAEKLARQMDPNALILKLANPARDQPSDWPQATLENFELVMTKMAEVARPQDRVMLLISTHSNPGTLNINVAGKNAAPITARGLSDALAPLAKTPTLVVLSACYSGAFLEPLRAPNRVVLTATDVHKASFKCQYPGEYTFFADALFNQAGAEQLSITDWMGAAQKSIQAQEKRKRLASSAPKMFVGEEAKAWASQPLKSWLQAR